MKDKLLKFANDLLSGEDSLPIYEELAKIFDENEMYHEVGACLEKIWHITQEHNLYKEMGDIFLYKVRNRDIAFAAYNKYLQYTQPEFYKNFADNLCKLGYDAFKYEPDEEDYASEIINLCDRYHAIVYIIILLSSKDEFDAVLEAANYLRALKNNIFLLAANIPSADSNIGELKDSDNHLSGILTEKCNNNEINKLAIELNPENTQAYLNVVEYFITTGNQDEAMNFYNTEYSNKFDKPQQYEFDKLCWAVSDYYKDCYEFYKAVLFQKYALEATDINGD